MPTLLGGMRVASIYVALIALGTYLVTHWVKPGADTTGLWTALFAVQLVGVACVVMVAHRWLQWSAIGFGRLQWRNLIWLSPAILLLFSMAQALAAQTPAEVFNAVPVVVWLLVVATPFLIAFAEEVIFRGILLQGAMQDTTILRAMLLSAVGFALAHLINALAGQEVVNTLLQTAFALLVGVSLAPIALLLGNLWPLIIWHWLWNIVVLSSQIMDILHPLAVIGMGCQAVVSIWLWRRLAKEGAKT